MSLGARNADEWWSVPDDPPESGMQRQVTAANTENEPECGDVVLAAAPDSPYTGEAWITSDLVIPQEDWR